MAIDGNVMHFTDKPVDSYRLIDLNVYKRVVVACTHNFSKKTINNKSYLHFKMSLFFPLKIQSCQGKKICDE